MKTTGYLGAEGLQVASPAILMNGFRATEAGETQKGGTKSIGTFPAKILIASLLITAATVAWTSLPCFHRAIAASKSETMVTSGLLVLLVASWSVTARSLLRCHRLSLEQATGVLCEREQLLQEQELLRAIIDHLPDHIYAKDRLGRFMLNNVAHAKSLGVTSPREMVGKTDFDYFPEHLATQFFADEQALIQSSRPILNQEQFIPVYGKPGTHFWVSATKVLWYDRQGRIIGTAGITRDINAGKVAQEALRRSEQKLRESTLQLERSNRDLQDFAYVASHDLQEPLRKIVVFGERIKEKCPEHLSPEAHDYLERMEKAARRMQVLISDLLTFSRVTSKAQALIPVDLAKTAREVVADLEARIELVKGRVELGPLPVIQADPLQMRQLLQNLIGNALKFFRPEHPPVVKLQAKIVPASRSGSGSDPPSECCELTVSDNGIGFDEKYLDRIFNVFQRLHTRNEYEGSGMGLAIARKIVLFHGGIITAKSIPGHGATFLVTLPVAHPKEKHYHEQ
jgi:PAS domain S-box-containing protein